MQCAARMTGAAWEVNARTGAIDSAIEGRYADQAAAVGRRRDMGFYQAVSEPGIVLCE